MKKPVRALNPFEVNPKRARLTHCLVTALLGATPMTAALAQTQATPSPAPATPITTPAAVPATPAATPVATPTSAPSTPAATPVATPTTPAVAPASDAAKPASEQLTTVTVQGQRDAESSNGITRTIGQAELTKDGSDNILDVLKRQPGITVTNGQISLRGIGSAYVRVLVDGQRPPPGFTLDQISPQMVERIEIIPGGGAEASAQSLGGTINIILKRTRNGQQGNLNVSAETGRFTDSIRTTANYGNSSGPWAWNISSNLRTFKGIRESKTDTAVTENGALFSEFSALTKGENANKSGNISPRITYTPNVKTRIQAQMGAWLWDNESINQRTNSFTLGPAPINQSGNSKFDGGGSGFWWSNELNQSISDTAKIEARINGGRWRFNGTNDRQLLLAGVAANEVDGDRNYGTWQGLKLTWRQTVSDKHNISVGVEHDGSDAKLNRINTLNGQSTLTADQLIGSQRVRQWAGFIRHEYDISQAWATDTGLRYEQVQYTVFQNAARTEAPLRKLFAPSLQVQYKPGGSKTEAVRFEIARKWRLIDVRELRLTDNRSIDNRFDNPDRLGNVFLKPEKSWTLDVAYTKKIGKEGSVGVTLTAKRFDDVIKNVTQFNDGRWQFKTSNIGSGDIRGVEIDTKGRLSDYNVDWPKTQVRASVARYMSELKAIAGPGNRVASQIPLILDLGFDHRFEGTAFSLGSSFKFSQRGLEKISERETVTNLNDRNATIYAQWNIAPKMNLRIAADDLLTKKSDSTVRYVGLNNETAIRNVAQTGAKFRISFDVRL